MRFRELKARLIAERHLFIYAPGQQLPDWGWRVIVWPSDYHPQGWSVLITHPHRLLNSMIANDFEALGYWVQWAANDARMEAWPNDFTSSVEFFESRHQDCDRGP